MHHVLNFGGSKGAYSFKVKYGSNVAKFVNANKIGARQVENVMAVELLQQN